MTCKPCKDIGVMRQSVSLQQLKDTLTADAAGHVDETAATSWQTVGTRKCKVLTRGGVEGYRFNQVQAEVTHIVELRSDSLTRTIAPTWRLLLDGRTLDITAAFDPDNMRQRIQVNAAEQV